MEKNFSRHYILITPVKNEEKYLPSLIQSIINQTIKPLLWVIVDDSSTDHTSDIINETIKKYDWILSIRLAKSIRDRGIHLATVIKTGFDLALKYCNENGIDFDYLGNVDADLILEKIYFENIIQKFVNNPKLGIASGIDYYIDGEKKTYYMGRYPSGGNMIFRKKCYIECGGIPLIDLWDSVLNAKATMKSWNINRFEDCRVFIKRGYLQADGPWKGYEKSGESAYVVNYNSFYALFKGVKLIFRKPYYIGFAYLYGYLNSMIQRKKQINDKEVKYYFQYIRPKESMQSYISLLRNKLIKTLKLKG